MGSALRLAHTLTGGATALLKRTRLIPDGRALVLEVPAGAPAFVLDPDRALDRLAKAMDFDSWAMRGI